MATQSGFFRSFLSTGHAPTLGAAFLFFTFSCCIWVLNGAMAPFISETFNLGPAQKGLVAALALAMLSMLRVMQLRWTSTWTENGGRTCSA